MKISINRNKLVGIFILISIIALIPILPIEKANAQLLDQDVFGGTISFVRYCGCSGTYAIYIFDFKSISAKVLVYKPGFSLIWPFANIFSDYILGSYNKSGAACRIPGAFGICRNIPVDGVIGNLPGFGTTQ